MASSPVERVAILGGGNLGRSLAKGWVGAGKGLDPGQIHLTRRRLEKLDDLREKGFAVGSNNRKAVEGADCVVLAVQPGQLPAVLVDIGPVIDPSRHTVVSVVAGVSLEELRSGLSEDVSVVRAMPNTAVSAGASMTCLCAPVGDGAGLEVARYLFQSVGLTMDIDESLMIPATALCACGVAFFLRSIRAAAQGGIEIGFDAEEALHMAAQTARGAAALVIDLAQHPESAIDRVTTPNGCTIAGLNVLEHEGFGSAMILGILASNRRAAGLE